MKPPLEITVQLTTVHSGAGTSKRRAGPGHNQHGKEGLAFGLGGGSPSQRAKVVLKGDGQDDNLPWDVTFENKNLKSLNRL